MTFNREVLSGLIYPALTDMGVLSKDAQERINYMKKTMTTPVGAYTANSKGYIFVREQVA
jgi:hypothetical protein